MYKSIIMKINDKKNEIAFVITSLPNNLHVHKYIFSKIGNRLQILKFIRGISDEHLRKVIKTSL
jgi:hypothetical protein